MSSMTLTLTTGDVKDAGSCNDAMIRFIDIDGHGSKSFKLDKPQKTCTLKRGRSYTFVLHGVAEGLGEVLSIEVWREGRWDDDLYLTLVSSTWRGHETHFPIHRWIPKDERLRIRRYDSFLPQNHPDPTARQQELRRRQEAYPLRQMTAKCETLPKEQTRSRAYQYDIGAKIVEIAKGQKAIQPTTIPTTLDELKSVLYVSDALPKPKSAEEDWHMNDECFGEQRLSGCNPMHIKLCADIPANFAVTSNVEPFLEGKTVAEALEKKRLFLTDFAILKDLKQTNYDLKLVAPLGLFYLTDAGKLLPVAIQLQQEPGVDNPVFLPSDPKYTWTMAKMWYNMAEATLHEARVHLGFTHLMVETICVITHRQLSPSHPVFKLLAPHYIFLMAINQNAFDTLLAPETQPRGGVLDRIMTVGRLGVLDIIEKTLATWRMNVEGTLPADIQDREVGADVLPHYPYRDDAMALYNIIKDYVRAVIVGHYDSEEALTDDNEIQAWVAEMARPVADGGAGIKGVPGGGKLTNTEDLIDIATFTIFTSSVQHAAVNFSQYDQYAFPPFYPLLLRGDPPTNKTALTETDIMNALPDIQQTVETMAVTSLLSERATNELSNFEVPYGYDNISKNALTKFQEDLKKAEEPFLERMNCRKDSSAYCYDLLNPVNVPNAISI